MLVWLVWERTEGVPAVRQLPNLPDQLPGGVTANTPDSRDGISRKETWESVFV